MGLDDVAYCGLYCGLCASRQRIPEQAEALRATLMREGVEQVCEDIPGMEEHFGDFWKGLTCLAEHPCQGCRSDGGNPGCAIRQCAIDHQETTCPFCPNYPCELLTGLTRFPLYFADGWRLKTVEIERWVAEQEARARSGFSYADVSFPDE
ncbi:MAG: DUF3795 domain-containing protein [Chloroflexi bacterium]|nr:DUF3795 domain-containing protein [Chloroflexota bacterium]